MQWSEAIFQLKRREIGSASEEAREVDRVKMADVYASW
jgi:hypothetical protein